MAKVFDITFPFIRTLVVSAARRAVGGLHLFAMPLFYLQYLIHILIWLCVVRPIRIRTNRSLCQQARPPLHSAALHGRLSTVTFLVTRAPFRAPLESASRSGRTALGTGRAGVVGRGQ
jgi:hypothetical protein